MAGVLGKLNTDEHRRDTVFSEFLTDHFVDRCKSAQRTSRICLPYACKLLVNELAAANVAIRFVLEDSV